MSTEPVAAGQDTLAAEVQQLQDEIEQLQVRVRQAEQRRRALLHIMGDLHVSNSKLGDQRRAMLHILADYEDDRSRLARQTERLDNSRRALLHILKDSHESNLRLGELTTGVAHELNNPLNNIGLFVGNVIDQIELGELDPQRIVKDLERAMEQVRKATEIISHLRTFGRPASVTLEPVDINDVIARSLSLMQEQLRLRGISVTLDLADAPLIVLGNAIQLEQVFVNLLTNARDALAEAERREVHVSGARDGSLVAISLADTGPGIAPGVEQRIFDPFFTTKEVGAGTGLGLSITYSIVKEHRGEIWVDGRHGGGANFHIQLPLAPEGAAEDEAA